MKFAELDLHPKIQDNLRKINFETCTPIQEQAIPHLMKGKDLAGLAQTGTGKTAAFLVPLINRILHSLDNSTNETAFKEWRRRNCLLVLVPTRELADQVYENALTLIPGTQLSAVAIYGGTTYEKQKAALKNGVELVIATPGRLIDLYKEHCFDMGQVRAVVFDEADRMFDMGFKDDMKFILRRLPRDRQFLVFSATLNFDVLNVAYEFGAEPVEINISRDQAKAEHVKDQIFHVGHTDKPSYLLSLLKQKEPKQTIIFSNFKRNVERIAHFLNKNGVPAVGISSLLTQAQRNRVMAQFKADNDRNILVATDLAARGLDILGVDLVINYELPDDPENYVHRIGRTGRAGQEGTAYSLVSDRDVDALARIEEFMKNRIETGWMDDAALVKDFVPFPMDDFGARSGGDHKGRRPVDRPRHSGSRSGSGPRPMEAGGQNRPPRQGDHRDRDRNRGRDRGYVRDQGRDQNRGGGDRDRDRNLSGDRPQGVEQPAAASSGGRSHRDRRTGRHGNQQNHQGEGRSGQRHETGPGTRQASRPEARSGSSSSGGSGGRRHQQHSRNQNGSRRPLHAAGRPATPAAASTSGGLGAKVSGMIKRLFGKKAAKSPTRSS